MKTIKYFLLLVGLLISNTVNSATIDTMFIYDSEKYPIVSDNFLLSGSPDQYLNTDGVTWDSGAGSFGRFASTLSSITTQGTTIFYEFDAPSGAIFMNFNDFGFGNNSASALLKINGPIIIEAELGTNVGYLSSTLLMEENLNTGSVFFEYFSASPGSILPLELTYTLKDGAIWNLFTFDNSFNYEITGNVDFTSTVPIPASIWLLMSGLVALFGIRLKTA